MNENQGISSAYDGKHDEYGHDLPRWMNFERAIDTGEMDPNQTATDYYSFELPNGIAMVIQSQPSHRDHPFIMTASNHPELYKTAVSSCQFPQRVI